MNSIVLTILGLFATATGDCGCSQGGPCLCGPDCQCAQFVGVAQDRKEAIRKADKADKSWEGWVRHSDGWWYNHNTQTTPAATEPETRGRIFRGVIRGGRRGGC